LYKKFSIFNVIQPWNEKGGCHELKVAFGSLELAENLIRIGGLALRPTSHFGTKFFGCLATYKRLLLRNLKTLKN
jgi:hypothetical protein